MRIENFEPGGKRDLVRTATAAQDASDNMLDSAGQGFAFPVHEKVRTAADDRVMTTPEDTEGISKKELLRAALSSTKKAWEEAIAPRIGDIRNKGIGTLKGGTDFFTEADTESEKVIVEEFNNAFPGKLQFFGEEANAYTGNLSSNITVRIDPIDGTEAFKFGKQDWGIMVGVYEGPHEKSEQIATGIYFPEMNTTMYYLRGVGVMISDLESGESKEIGRVRDQDEITNVLISYYRHSKREERGENEGILRALDQEGARVKFNDSTCGDVLESLMTGGQRIIIYDGDMNKVDYIPFKMLQEVGYKIFPWEGGEEIPPEDPNLQNKKVVIVPPGKAGERVRELIRNVHGN
jgi:fructose-1,6-bisphosphatase/inositol monophosphatase family enzyme